MAGITFVAGLAAFSAWAALFSLKFPLTPLKSAFLAELVPNTPLLSAIRTSLSLVLPSLPVALLLCALHEWCHGLTLRCFGVRPSYGAKPLSGHFVFYTTIPPGTWLTRDQYAVVTLAPTVAVNTLGLLLLALPSLQVTLIVALSFHLAGCLGDWLMTGKMMTLPAGSEFEDTKDGFRYRPGPGGARA